MSDYPNKKRKAEEDEDCSNGGSKKSGISVDNFKAGDSNTGGKPNQVNTVVNQSVNFNIGSNITNSSVAYGRKEKKEVVVDAALEAVIGTSYMGKMVVMGCQRSNQEVNGKVTGVAMTEKAVPLWEVTFGGRHPVKRYLNSQEMAKAVKCNAKGEVYFLSYIFKGSKRGKRNRSKNDNKYK